MKPAKSPKVTTAQLAEQVQATKEELATLRSELQRGLRFCHVAATHNQGAIRDTQATLNGLGHVLAEKQALIPADVQQARDAYANAAPPAAVRVRIGLDTDKYSDAALPAEIDCAARLPLCHAACCRLHFVLGTQDLDEGVVKWDYGVPYVVRQDANGWCTHLSADRECGVHEQRPLACRRYDCRDNPDIWIDFERRIPNPKIERLPDVRPAD